MIDLSINDLPLPILLVEMLHSGRWKAPNDKDVIRHLGIEDADDLSFIDLVQMKNNTNQLHQLIVDGYGDVMGLCSNNLELLAKGYLDVTKAVIIAATFGDEALCLDYSSSIIPKIVATGYTGSQARWKVVADNLEKFVEILEI